MIKTIIAAAAIAFASSSLAKERVQVFPPGGGVALCPSEWMIATGPELADIYCDIPAWAIAQWAIEDGFDGRYGAPIALPAAEDAERMKRIRGASCAPGFEDACHARDHGTDGLRRSNPVSSGR